MFVILVFFFWLMISFLSQLRASCEARRIPLISPETQEFLEQLLERKRPKNILEI
jgi:predicted O-methyltransferase YrrM